MRQGLDAVRTGRLQGTIGTVTNKLISSRGDYNTTLSVRVDSARRDLRRLVDIYNPAVKAGAWMLTLLAYIAYLVAQQNVAETFSLSDGLKQLLLTSAPQSSTRLASAVSWIDEAFVKPAWRYSRLQSCYDDFTS